MTSQTTSARARFRQKVDEHAQLVSQLGEAIERRSEVPGVLPRTRHMADEPGLAERLRKAIPVFADLGIEMEVVDISNDEVDAALEIMRTCPCLEASKACGLATPSSALCHLEVETNRRALPGTDVRPLSRRVDDGSCICIFKYERPRAAAAVPAQPQARV